MRPPSGSRRWISLLPVLASPSGCGGHSSSARWPLGVVVVGVDAERPFKVAAVEDQQPVETLRADGSDEALCDRVCLRRPRGSLHGPDTFAAEDFVEGAAVLAVAVADQQADVVGGEVEAEVARLLGHPVAGGIPRAAGQPQAPNVVRDEEEHVVAAHEDALDREEVTRDNARCLRSQEFALARAGAPPRGYQPRLGEQPADARRRHSQVELGQLTTDPPMAPARVLAREPQHELPDLRRLRRSPAPASGLSPLPTHQRPMPAQKRPWSHHKHTPRRARQVTGCGCQQRPISPPRSAVRTAGTGSRVRGAAPATRCLSHAGRGGCEQAHRTETAPRGRGTRRPCRRSSHPWPRGEPTPILAPLTKGRCQRKTGSGRDGTVGSSSGCRSTTCSRSLLSRCSTSPRRSRCGPSSAQSRPRCRGSTPSERR